MRWSIRYVAVVIFTLCAVAAHAAPPGDDYIKGYAAAILAREFKLRAPSLQVTAGTIRVHESDLAGVDRSALEAALAGIEGVSRVVIVSDRTIAADPARRPQTMGGDGSVWIGLLETGWLPGGLLFRPLLADPRWPHFSLVYRYYLDEDDLGAVIAGTLGENLSLYRWTAPPSGQWEVGAFALAAPLFDRDHEDDLLTADYQLGLFLGWRRGALSGLARAYHTSSHLGDELVLRGGITRVNLSYETIDARLSWEFTDELRLYGGAGYRARVDPRSLDRWWLQAGLEFRSAWRAWQLLRPVAALDLQSREQNDWLPALSLRAGAQLDSLTILGRSAQLLLEYYIGDSREGQFYTRDVQYFGVGVHFNF